MDEELNMVHDLEFKSIQFDNSPYITVREGNVGVRKAKSNLVLKEQLPLHFSGTLNNMTISIKFSFYNLRQKGEKKRTKQFASLKKKNKHLKLTLDSFISVLSILSVL